MELHALDYQNRFFSSRLFAIFLFLIALSFSGISAANAGVDWLSAQATTAGSYSDNLEIATDFQSTAETIHTLYELQAITQADLQNPISYLHADTLKNTESLSRIILGNILFGIETTSFISDLLKHSNSDGGFAEFAGYESTTLDTAFALQAIAASYISVPQTTENAIAYLLNKQNPDGGFSLSDSNESSVYVTSLCLSALQQYIFQYNLSETLSSATEYLFSRQFSVGGWDSNWETALALSAVAPITTDVTLYVDAVSVLKTAQNVEGSWDDSVYTTALALQVLHRIQNIELPLDVNAGVLTGRVVNAVSGLPLANVSIITQGIESSVVLTQADGRFTASNLSTPLSYTVTYSATGYQSAIQNISVDKGQHLYLGVIQLSPLPDTGFLTGIVSDAGTGQAVSDASIKVSYETGNIIVNTKLDGSFFITINPGPISITVSAAGYADVTASGEVVLGNTLSFSPALYLEGISNPGPSVKLRGTVVDADTFIPLQGVKISFVDSIVNDVFSDATGSFEFADVTAGEIQLELQLPGYQSTRLSMLLSSNGEVELGNIQLRPLTGSETLVSGTVTDNETGNVIAGAAIDVMGNTVISDVNGHFQLDGITALAFSISASAPGYLSLESQLVLQEAGPIQVDIPLQAAIRGEVEIVSVVANQPDFDAYSLVTIRSLVQNKDVFNQDIQLLGEIIDSNEQIIHRFPLSVAHDEGEIGESITIAANESLELEGIWPIQANVAGNYQLKIKLFDANSGQLLSEKATSVTIDETQEIRFLQLKASPGYTNFHETEQVELNVDFINLSNTVVTTEYDYSILDPDGEIINSGVVSLQITPDEQQKSFVVDSFSHTFDKSGIYTIELQHRQGMVAGQVLAGSISVAPGTRVELNQNILPSSILPEGDKRIRLGIEIKGVQQ